MVVRHGGDEHEEGEGPWITKDVVVLLHGLGMILAWGFFLNVGSVIGRYYKKPPHDLFAPRWFEWHATFQTVGFFIALGSGLLIIVHLSWNRFPGEHLGGLHQVMGVLLLLCAIAQPIIGVEAHRDFLRLRGPGRFHPPHRWLGRFLMLAAVPTMGFGFKELGKHIMQIDTIVWWAFAILVVLGTVIISYGEWSLSGQVKPRPAKSEFELRDVTGKSGVVDEDHYGTDEVDAVDDVRMSAAASVNNGVEEDKRTVVDFVFEREEVLRKERKRSQTVLIGCSVLSLGIVLFICGYMINSYRNMDMDQD